MSWFCIATGDFYYTADEAARLIGISATKLKEAGALGLVPKYLGIGSEPYFRLCDIFAALDCSPNGGWR